MRIGVDGGAACVARTRETGRLTDIAVESHTLPQSVQRIWGAGTTDELVWARRGAFTARLGRRLFTVPTGFGLWLPAGSEHPGHSTADAVLVMASFTPGRALTSTKEPTTVVVTPLLEALLLHLMSPALSVDHRLKAEAVVVDVITPSPHETSLQLPQGPIIGPIAAALLESPEDRRSVEQWSQELEVGVRTISRAFRTQTGLSFSQWRQAVRIQRAISLLCQGWPVQEVAIEIGYTAPSAFIQTFNRVVGQTPGAFAAQCLSVPDGADPAAQP